MNNRRFDDVVDFVEFASPTAGSVAVCGLYRSRGGASRVIEQQSLDLVEAGYDVTIFALEADMAPPEDVELRVMNPVQERPLLSKLFWLLSPVLPWMIGTIFSLSRFDVILAHRYPYTIAGYVCSRITNSIYVFWSHPSGDSASGFSGIAKAWLWLVHRFETRGRTVANADFICAVSEESRDYLESKISRQVAVVPNKVTESRFTSVTSAQDLQSRYGFDSTDQIVLFVGRVTERKNVHRLVQVFDDASDEIDDARLLIVGEQPQSDYYSKLLRESGRNVVFTGHVPDADLAGLYNRADVFATCSLEEGWGLPISEAELFDTQIIAFDTHPAAVRATDARLIGEGDYSAFRKALVDSLQ